MTKYPSAAAARVALLYALAAGAWIFFSDRALALLVPDGRLFLVLQTYKGWGFVVVTAVLLFVLLRAYLGRWIRESVGRGKAEDSLRESEEQYRSLLNGLPIGIVSADANGTITFANPAAGKLFDVEAEGGSVEVPAGLSGSSEALRMGAEMVRAIRGGGRTFELQIQAAGGGTRRLRVTATPQGGVSGGVHGVLGALQDITEQVRLAQQLETEMIHLRTLVSALPEGVFLKDAGSRFQIANGRVAEIMGVPSPEDLVGRTDHDFYPRELADAFLTEDKQVMEQGRPLLNREDHFTVRGEQRWVLTSKLPVVDDQGRVTGLVGVSRDVTESRRAEEELSRKTMYLSALMDGIPDCIYFKDTASRFLLNNRAHARLVGLSDPAEMGGRTDFDFFTEASARASFETEQSIVRTGEPAIGLEEHDLWRDGEEVWFESTKMPLRDETGAIIGIFGISRDITQARQAREALRHSEEHYRSTFLNSPLGIFHSTAAGKQLDVNPALARMYGFDSPEEIMEAVNRQDIGRVLFEDPAERARIVEEVLRADGWRKFENVRYRRRDGTPLVVTLTMRPYRRPGSSEIELEGFVEDTTERERVAEERRRFQEQLQQAQKMEAVGRLAGGIAHDFNNLLTVIGGYGDLALEQTGPGDEVRSSLGEITAASRRAAALTSQLLAFSRRQILKPRLIDLDELIGGMVDMLQRLLGEDITLRTLRTAGLWRVLADPGMLEQVVMNLAVNARDAMPQGGTLTLETGNSALDHEDASARVDVPAGEYVLLTVSDTGQGMDSATLERIFEPFFTTKEKGKGTGLGLATVYGIVKQSGGHVECSSRVGRGTTFRILLPRAVAGSKAEAEGSPETPAGGTETVLLVEDEEVVRRFASSVLAKAGYTVLSAASGPEALEILKERGAEAKILVTDVVMPGMDGRTVAREAVRRFPDLPVLYLTGYTEDAIVSHGVLEAGVHLQQKPFTAAELLGRVRSLLDAVRFRGGQEGGPG